ncbi:MAG: hypothetical protein ACIARR_03150 [Phycisphaerales bacterium JB059]
MIEDNKLRWQAPISESLVEGKPAFRADMDQAGDWYVWRRLGANGWATLRRCACRESAIKEAAALNQPRLDPNSSLG